MKLTMVRDEVLNRRWSTASPPVGWLRLLKAQVGSGVSAGYLRLGGEP